MQKNIQFKKQLLPHLVAVLFFALISTLFLLPDIAQGRVLFQHDTAAGVGTGEEARAYKEASGEATRWTNSSFSGMPTYQISPSYESDSCINLIKRIYQLGLPQIVSYLFLLLLGFYILLLALDVKWYIAALGAFAYAFSSYFVILIQAGHIWKLLTLAYIPPTLAGVILAYRGRYLLGGAVAALFAMMQLSANHIQMSYYFGFLIVALVVAYGVDCYQQKELPRFFKATATLAVAALLAVGSVLPNLYNTYQYSKESMRGKAALRETVKSDGKQAEALSSEYITQWSYGIGETWTLLIPNAKGGGSALLSSNPDAMEAVDAPLRQQVGSSFSHYWGNQPMTSGPVYVGAFVLFLFLLGCFIVKGAFKWGLVAATVLTILLSWGHNFMPLTQFFIDYFPLYNKFRAVSSLLVVAECTIPLLAMLALVKIIQEPTVLRKERVGLLISLALTGGAALLFALLPDTFFDFVTTAEGEFFASNANYQPLLVGLEAARIAIFRADAWRSFFIIALGTATLWAFYKQKLKGYMVVGILAAITILDLFTVNKRYLNSSHFVAEQQVTNPFPLTATDQAILQDSDPNYRVLNLATSTFNDAATSYHHKSIGGYHAAKLRSYQDIIDYYMNWKTLDEVQNSPILNMLNTKYYIIPDGKGGTQPVANPNAMGNGWLVENVAWQATPLAEMEALGTTPLHTTAVVNEAYRSQLETLQVTPLDPTETVTLTHYQPNQLRYQVAAKQGRLAVFSEIYYPEGWRVTIDGKEVEMIPVNYLLRGLYIPEGSHEVVFDFHPQAVTVTQTIAFISIGLILLLLGVAIYQTRKESLKS